MGIKEMLQKNLNWPPTLENSKKANSVEDIINATKKPSTVPPVAPVVDQPKEPAVTAKPEEKPVDNFMPPVESIPSDKVSAVNYLKKKIFTTNDSDYLKVMITYGKLGEFIEDPHTRIKAALSLSGIREVDFTKSVDFLVSSLDREHDALKEKAQALLSLQTDSFRSELEICTSKAAEIDEQVTALNLSITRLLAQKGDITKKIDELNTKIEDVMSSGSDNTVVDEAHDEIRQTLLSKKEALIKVEAKA